MKAAVAPPAAPAAATGAAAGSGAGAGAGSSSSEAGPSSSSSAAAQHTAQHQHSELRVRCEDGTVLRHTFGADEPLAAAAALVAARRAEEDGPFSLLTPFPRCEYSSAAQLQTTLRQVT